MTILYLGEAIRQRRKALGVPQELVCEGLCTTMTLSRFESGRQTPSRDCAVAIMQRLGLSADQYYAQLTRRETLLLRLKKDAQAYYHQFDQTPGEEREQFRMSALAKLRELERLIKEDDHINQQFILGMKVALELHSPQDQLEMLMTAIRLTSPRFNVDEISSCLYSTLEVAIINKIAIRYALCGQPLKAIDIFRQLLELVQTRTADHDCLPLILYNYALHLASEKRLEDALKISAIGRQTCIRQEHYHMLPRFLHVEVGCHYLSGEIDKCLDLYRSAYHIYGAVMDISNQEILKSNAKECFNLTF